MTTSIFEMEKHVLLAPDASAGFNERLWKSLSEVGPEWACWLYQKPGCTRRRYLLGNFTLMFKVIRELIRSGKSAEVLP